jgi:hypothetical protein
MPAVAVVISIKEGDWYVKVKGYEERAEEGAKENGEGEEAGRA